jgi:anion-transporting  ArsA/GET3 family ATPase
VNAPTAAAASPRPPLAQVVLVTGKGGVGKTTVAAGLAVALARRAGRAALVEFGDGESGTRALGPSRREVDHIVVRPDEAIQRAAVPLFGSAILAKVALGNFAMKRFFKASPAIRELAQLEAIRVIAAEKRGRPVVVDMPATGHGLAWLRVPLQLREVARSGPFFELNDRLARELVAPGKCSVVIVTLPEPLVLRETTELCEGMRREVGLEPARLVVNRMPAPVSEDALAEARALGAQETPVGHAARALRDVLQMRAEARAEAHAALQRAAAGAGLAPVTLPEAPVDPKASDVAEWLTQQGAVP